MAGEEIVTINVGSSSVKVDCFGATRRQLHLSTPDELAALSPPATVVHRLVHGGPHLRRAVVLDDACLAELRSVVAWAPLHLPAALRWIDAARARWPAARQVGCLDTALYRDLPAVAATYALPKELRERFGIVRYGFHGLAHASMLRALGRPRRAITIQLGSGASMTAFRDGRAVDTTMGFSPLEGLVMATRPGDVDAGALLRALRGGLDVDTLDRLLEHESGLRGLAGDGDMRALLARDDDDARLAVELYVYRARKYLGAMLAVLGGCDAIAFGGGVGEHAPAIRAAILDGFAWAGLDRAAVRVVAVDEAEVMRDEAAQLLAG